MSLITAPLCEYYQTLFALGVDKARARCYNVRYVNGILNIYFRVRGGGTLRARIYDQGISRMSAGVGTLFARQNPCQLRGLATPDSAIFLVILHNYFGNIYYTSAVNFETIALLIRWADQLNKDDNMSKYTPTMIEKMGAAQPLNLAKAQSFASEFGVSHRSIIAKALSLGLTYEKKAVSSSSSDRPTKADIVREIEQSLQGESLDGLQGASMRSLQSLLMSIG